MVYKEVTANTYNNNNDISCLIDEIRRFSTANKIYFKDSSPDCVGNRIHTTLNRLLQHLEHVRPSVRRILIIAPTYDFTPSIQANGYHSLLTVFRKCCLKILEIVRRISLYRDSWLFDAVETHATLEEFVTALGQLRACFYYMERLHCYCAEGTFYPDENLLTEDEYASAVAHMYEFETLDPECFYGRCIAFQYAPSMRLPLTVINQALACHSEVFSKPNYISKLAAGLIGAGVYFRDVRRRARQVATTTRECSVDFCRSFWSLSDNPLLLRLSLLACPGVAIDTVLTIPFGEIEMRSTDSDRTEIVGPLKPERFANRSSRGPIKRHVNARLLSAKLRSGQEEFLSIIDRVAHPWKVAEDKSPHLIIHLHGGGFVGQSSASHEVYLRNWAVKSEAPILSVDYSHAPDFRAPYQVEEAFYAYCWALKNSSLLGTTGERVVVVGDSAGGTLAVGVGLMAAHRGVRVPDALYPIYGCMMVQYKPGPSRMMAIMDPLIPLGILSICLQAYLGTVDDSSSGGEGFQDSIAESNVNELEGVPSGDLLAGASLPASRSPLSSSSTTTLSDADRSRQNAASCSTAHRRSDSGFFDNSSDGKPVTGRSGINPTDRDEVAAASDRAAKTKKFQEFLQVGESRFGEEVDFSDIVSENSTSSVETPSTDKIRQDVIASYAQLKTFKVSPMARSLRNNSGESPFISPVLAPDGLLSKLNRVHITACHLDPLLDDSITLARRLLKAGVQVEVDMVDDLPHGFLNFVTLSAEAYQASQRCLNNVLHLLKGETCV